MLDQLRRDPVQAVLASVIIVFGTGSAVSFTNSTVFGSPVTKFTVILTMGVVIVTGLYYLGDALLQKVGLVLFVLYAVVDVLYLLSSFQFSQLLVTLILGGVAGVSMIAVYALRSESSRLLTKQVLTGVSVVALLVSVVIAGVDVTAGDPTYTVDTLSQPDVSGTAVTVATITVSNPNPLPQQTQSQSYVACVSNNITLPDTSQRNIGYESVGGSTITQSQTEEVRVPLPPRQVNTTLRQSLATASIIQTDTCPVQLPNNTVAVYPNK